MTELDLQKFTVELLRLNGVFAFAVPNGEHRSKRTGARLKAMGVRKGAADLLIFAPPGQAYCLELKSAKGRLSPEQKEFQAACIGMGIPYAVASSPEDVETILDAWGVLRKQARAA